MTDIWKRKLAAYLHDPPSKCLDIRTHGERSEKAMQAAGLDTPGQRKAWERLADHTAAAADRFPFPHHSKAKLSCAFDGVRNTFHHPLDGESCLSFDGPFISVEEGIEGEQTTQPVLNDLGDLSEHDQWRARFLAHWRLWPGASAAKDWRLAFLPADTRIPDHTIWAHMQMVSALDSSSGSGGVSRPAFLKFQLGPVQDFIQASRSTRDLWSGSYLLSWLMAHGLARLSLEIGPDAVVFPNLRDQPLLDLALKRELWDRVRIGNQPIWASHASMKWSHQQLLTPNLPNVFFAVVPADQASELTGKVESAIREEWKRIAESVWSECNTAGLWKLGDKLQPYTQRRERFEHQYESFLSLSWAVIGWPANLSDVENLAGSLPATDAANHYKIVKSAAEAIRRLDQHDERYFDAKGQLKNDGIAWALLVALSSWQLDAVRQTRFFAANAANLFPSRQNTKDSLTGKDEAIAGGEAWRDFTGALGSRFKHDDYLAAPTLIKRLWDRTYLHREWMNEVGRECQSMPNTRDLAAHCPDEDSADEDSPADPGDSYFAVIAFDGDDMGKWVAGEKTPLFGTQLADYEGGGALEYFQRPQHASTFADFIKTPRPLSPAYHLQFSECLSNFALRCVWPIVEAHDGRLIYAGGDDVVALLPADTALACANDLQLAFTGRSPLNSNAGIAQKSPGFLTSKEVRGDDKNPIPFMVPGTKASASVGIAIAHFKAPLQDVVRAAQSAEKRAKKLPEKSAVAVTLLKRSGETVEWDARWSDHGVEAAFTLLAALRNQIVSAKFPYRLGELMTIYRTQTTALMKAMDPVEGFDLPSVFSRELLTVLARQRGSAWDDGGPEFVETFTRQAQSWLQSMIAVPEAKPEDPPLSDEQKAANHARRLDHAVTQLVAMCAFCGFAKRLNT